MNTFCAGKVIEPTEKEATLEKKIYIYKSREGEEVSFQKPVGCNSSVLLQISEEKLVDLSVGRYKSKRGGSK